MTRLLFPAFVVGVGVSSLTGSDLLGALLAVATIAVLVVVRRVTGTSATCAIAPAPPERAAVQPEVPAGSDLDA